MSVEHARQQAKQAGVDETVIDRLLTAAKRRQIHSSTQIQWLRHLQTAAEEGLPLEPLNNKIEEGLCKEYPWRANCCNRKEKLARFTLCRHID